MFVAGYGHFVRTARSLQWDEQAVDLREDQAAWPELEPGRREALRTLLTGFCVGEARVAEELGPFARATPDPEAAECFELQEGDEARHARFFDRCAREIVAVPGAGAGERRSRLRQEARPEFLDLFERRLPQAVRRLTEHASTLEAAVGLYHLVLEGVVFTAGQLAMLELLEDRSLPGVHEGLELVLRDERWHIGFGTRMLTSAADAPPAEALDAVDYALDAWGDAVSDEVRQRVLHLHRRRLGAAGLIPAGRGSTRAAGPVAVNQPL